MLAISPLTSLNNGDATEEFALDQEISFDDLFVGFDDLPDLEIDPCDIFADFSFTSGEDGDGNNKDSSEENGDKKECFEESSKEEAEVVSTRTKEDEKKSPRKKSSTKKLSQSKKKTKVDWTPELHRRFVEAVEKLGLEKAVPSRILELMGIDCLTRHNIASHLQKYRSHRKHVLAREAEATRLGQRRNMYATIGNHRGGVDPTMISTKPNWAPSPQPMVGFPPTTHHHYLQNYRPLHVWGHPPAVEHPPQLLFVWPRPPYWQHGQAYQRSLAQGTPCFPPPPLLPPTGFSSPSVTGIPPHRMVRPPLPQYGAPLKTHSTSHVQLDVQPSNESIDAAIGDVLTKPWLPLPLGLKPPSLDGVMAELHKQGVAKVPPTCV